MSTDEETPTPRTCPHCGASFDAEFQNGVIGYSCLTMVGSEGVDRTHACYERENAALREELAQTRNSRDSFHTHMNRALAREKRLREAFASMNALPSVAKTLWALDRGESANAIQLIIKRMEAALAFDGKEESPCS
jgi:hypothetical protein